MLEEAVAQGIAIVRNKMQTIEMCFTNQTKNFTTYVENNSIQEINGYFESNPQQNHSSRQFHECAQQRGFI